MSVPTEDVLLYAIIAFIVIENFIEIYLARRQVSESLNKYWNRYSKCDIDIEKPGLFVQTENKIEDCSMSSFVAIFFLLKISQCTWPITDSLLSVKILSTSLICCGFHFYFFLG